MTKVTRGPLEGVRILKLGTGVAGPAGTRVLGNLGAEIIKVESMKRMAADHSVVPPWEPDLGVQIDIVSPMRNDYHAGDLSVGIELTHPKGLAVFKELVKVSDALLICFSAPTARKLGIDYPDLRAVKPDIIYVNLTSFGIKGPYFDFALWGFNILPMAGVTGTIGYADSDEPMGVGGITLCDYSGGLCVALAVLSALHYRERTGNGQFVDEALMDVAASTAIGPAILDYTANGRVAGHVGNRAPDAAPHGVYRCRGEDRWCAIAVHTEDEWAGFCRAIGNPPWTKDARFASLHSRLANQDDLDRFTEEFTSQRDPFEVMFLMQQEGVPAGVAQTADDLLLRDLQLRARDFFIRTPMVKQGDLLTYDLPMKLSGTPCSVERGASCLGEDNDYVLHELLGLSSGEVETLISDGAIYPFSPGDPKLRNRSLTSRWTGSLGTSLPRADHLRW